MGWSVLQIALIVLLAGLLLAAGIEDVRRREIANITTGAIALLAPLWWLATGVAPWPDLAIQVATAVIVFALFCATFYFGWMGGGDVKLIGAVALWLSPSAMVTLLVVMSIAGGVITLLMVTDHKFRRRSQALEVPYGVAIAVAGLFCLREPVLNQFT
jgi:prepilin peptidase CpaA